MGRPLFMRIQLKHIIEYMAIKLMYNIIIVKFIPSTYSTF